MFFPRSNTDISISRDNVDELLRGIGRCGHGYYTMPINKKGRYVFADADLSI